MAARDAQIGFELDCARAVDGIEPDAAIRTGGQGEAIRLRAIAFLQHLFGRIGFAIALSEVVVNLYHARDRGCDPRFECKWSRSWLRRRKERNHDHHAEESGGEQ